MSTNSDRAYVFVTDFWAALGLLTRLPLRVDMDRAQLRGAAAAWAYPLVGLVIGIFLAAVAQAALFIGLGPSLAAMAVLLAGILLTGALHEDGLADCADGLWGGYSPQRRLEIMKDSAIGTYGVLALILSLMIRWAALKVILGGDFWLAIIATAVISRAPMVVAMAVMPNARQSGLSHSVGRPSAKTAVISAAIAGGLAVVFLGTTSIPVIAAVIILAVVLTRIAQAKIGGQTGDILGAMQQLAEIGALLAIVAVN